MPDSHKERRSIEYEAIDALRNMAKVEKIWCRMLSGASNSFFLSWEWISTWLTTLPNKTEIDLMVGRIDDEPVVAFFIGKKNITRHKLFHYRTASLNSTGDDYLDEISIECNGALFSPGMPENIITEVCTATTRNWDELYLPGLSGNPCSQMETLKKQHKNTLNVIVERDTRSYYVDLKKIRDSEQDYFSLLSSNRRQQIRRSIREYEKQGKIELRQAETREEALKMLENLAALHQQEWNKRGKPGAFSNNFFLEFHRTLIDEFFSTGIIQLVHIYNPSSTIGYLYNYVHENDVLFYQCGFHYTDNNHARPGLISHYLTILMNTRFDYGRYDFLAGDSQYKKSLATDHYKMIWIKLQRKNFRSWLEHRVGNIYRKANKMRNRK